MELLTMTDSPNVRTTRSVFAWEARWILVEMAGTALGLLLGLGYDRWDAASLCLFGVCIVSWIVRCWHYGSGLARK
jgi:hypothetical protein